ncbi:hypothetical protein [Promicromonospora sp. NFX87]|uniref:hypothetical protein n=1 Tax=Promicromonospora sp. NFX87 TaxID=3402691 RepID=UPI003AFA68E8
MAVNNYIPEIWHAALLENLHQNTFIIPTLNHDYEGDIVNGGEKVKITGFTTPTVKTYTGSITRDAIVDNGLELLIDQMKYYAYLVDDVDKVQAAGSFDAVQADAGLALADVAEDFVITDMLTNGTSAGTTALATFAAADAAVKTMRTAMVKAKVPTAQRYLAANPEFAGWLMDAGGSLFKANESGSDQTLRNGVIGTYRGFTVIETPSAALANAGRPGAVGYWGRAYGFAEQLVKDRAQTVTDAFGDQVDGLHVYGGKVIRPTAVRTWLAAA